MPVIDDRQTLAELLHGCSACYAEYCENAPLIADDDGNISDEQVPLVLDHMKKLHQSSHVH